MIRTMRCISLYTSQQLITPNGICSIYTECSCTYIVHSEYLFTVYYTEKNIISGKNNCKQTTLKLAIPKFDGSVHYSGWLPTLLVPSSGDLNSILLRPYHCIHYFNITLIGLLLEQSLFQHNLMTHTAVFVKSLCDCMLTVVNITPIQLYFLQLCSLFHSCNDCILQCHQCFVLLSLSCMCSYSHCLTTTTNLQ